MTVRALPERLIRAIWEYQLFSTSHLHTDDGRQVMIFSPGRRNEDAGPDFTDALVRIGNPTYRGDVEIHRTSKAWEHHRHHADPRYNRVILHVVLTTDGASSPGTTQSGRSLPLLVLNPYLDSHLDSLLDRHFSCGDLPLAPRLRCRDQSHRASREMIESWATTLSEEWLEQKIRQMEGRLRELIDERITGTCERHRPYHEIPGEELSPFAQYDLSNPRYIQEWEQLLYEGIMQAMGYAKNQVPFRELARRLRLRIIRDHFLKDSLTLTAMLFGTAGLLSSPRRSPDRECQSYRRQLRRRWKELAPRLRINPLHQTDWLFFRLRPANFPTARLAAAAFLLPRLFKPDGQSPVLEIIGNTTLSHKERSAVLHEAFRIEPDGFWRSHLSFNRPAGSQGTALGRSRTNEILMNVVFPFTLLNARASHNRQLAADAKTLLERCPPLQENVVTRIMKREFPHSHAGTPSALRQQGLHHLYVSYCARERCTECSMATMFSLPPASGG